MSTKVSAAAGVLTAVVLAVSGCGSDSTSSTAASTTASGQPSGSAAPGGGRPGGQQITAVNLNTDGAGPGGLPAPLLARRGRWVRADDLRRGGVRVVHVVTAFAVGHSITLALAALGYLTVPTRLVESMIALSILVSGVHAVRPVVRRGEVWIATGFGLMHGLAFAALLGGLDLGSLVTELLGFNLGIELTQLIVVALVMPSLIVLSRTPLYPMVRTTLAAWGIVLAAAWLAERTTLIADDPLEPVSATLVAHPFLAAAVLAGVAATAWTVQRRRARRRHRDSAVLMTGP